MVVLDVDDELGQRLELEPAAAEPAAVGEERGGGDARHVRGAGAFTGRAGGGGGGGGGGGLEEKEEGADREAWPGGGGGGGGVSGSEGPGGLEHRGGSSSRHRPGGQTGQRRTQLGGGRAGRWG